MAHPPAFLILGAQGMLGRAWRGALDAEGIGYAALDLGEVDITDASSVERAIAPGATTVVNCAAYTDVDGAEQDEERATQVNGLAVGHLAERCRATGARLVHYSTDYVFDGDAAAPYPVDAPYAPINAYGRSKAEGERRALAAGGDALVLRTSWLYAPWGKNFVRTMARLCRERDNLRVVDDQRGRPSSAEHLVAVTLRLLQQGAAGVFHVTDGGECTWYQLACAIAAHVRPTCQVDPCTTAEFPRPAARPTYSVLDIGPTERLAGPMVPWQDNLTDVLRRMEAV